MKSIEQRYKKLNEVEHVLHRPGRYIGSITPHTADEFIPQVESASSVKMLKRSITYNPGFLKLFDEVISNSADHSKRADGKNLDTIRVEVDREAGEIIVFDNGGIPVIKHKEYDQWIPEMIFELRAGSNFDDTDEAMLTGQNGEGAALTNIFSTKFVVETCDGSNKFKMVFEDHSQNRKAPKIVAADGAKGFTRITYYPDFEKLGMKGIDDDNFAMLLTRVYQVAAVNTHLKVYFNGVRVMTRSFKDYVEMFVGDNDYAYDETDHWKIGVAHSDESFQHVSFVNGTHTKIGGTHINYVGMQIWEAVRAFVKKKHKIDVKPAELRQHMIIFIDAQIVNPRYSSQTKDDLITETRDYKTSWIVPDKMINKILKSNIVQSILDWAEAKAKQEELRELRKLNKDGAKFNLKHIKKFSDATSADRKNTACFLAEGDSASGPIRGSRDPKLHGVFPLRGRPINVSAAPLSKVKENEEFENVRMILGLKYGEPADLDNLNFGKVIIASDADEFGHSIAGLIVNMFYRLWPNLVEAGRVYRLITPVAIVSLKKEQLEFFTMADFEEWREKNPTAKYTYKFLKGLGSSPPALWKKYMSNLDNYLVKFTMQDAKDRETLDLCFLKDPGSADKRKVWLDIE